jgi:hypothetical protein
VFIVCQIYKEDVQTIPAQLREALHFLQNRSVAFLIFEVPDADLSTGVPSGAVQFEHGQRGGLCFYDNAREVEELIRAMWHLEDHTKIPELKVVGVATRRVGQKVRR